MDAPPVRYVRTSDGYDIAYRLNEGSGPALLFLPAPLYDMDLVWRTFPGWMEGFARRFRVIQFDFRGGGYSSRNLPRDVSMEDFYRDVEAVAERVAPERLFIWAWAGTSHLAVRYGVDHPERVAALLLNTPSVSNAVWKPVHMSAVPQENWTLFLRMLSPVGLSAEETRRHVRALRACMTPQDWDATSRAGRASDIAAYLPELHRPALVLHAEGSAIEAQESIGFAAMVRGARFARIGEGYLFGDAEQGLAAIDAFLQDLPGTSPSNRLLSLRELDVLRLLAAGRSNQQIAEALVISPSTVSKHVSAILTKTESANRTEAAAYAHRHGLV